MANHEIAGVTRRDVLRGLGAGSGLTLLGSAANVLLPSVSAAEAQAITDHERETVMALIDTVLPNDDGAPGGNDANGWQVVSDPFYGLAPNISGLVVDVDAGCVWLWPPRGLSFKELCLADRTWVLEARLGEHGSLYRSWWPEMYESVILLTKLAFFGGIVNRVGYDYIGFPGETNGYWPGPSEPPSCAATVRAGSSVSASK